MIIKILKEKGGMQLLSIFLSFFCQISFVYLWGEHLTKDEIGMISLVSVITTFGMIFSNLGITNYVLYKNVLSSITISTLNIVMFLITCSVSVLVVIVAPYYHYLFNIKFDMTTLIYISALFFPFIGASVTSQAILIKNKDLNDVAKAEMFSRIASLFIFSLLLNYEATARIYLFSQLLFWIIKSFGLMFYCNRLGLLFFKKFDHESINDFWPYLKSLLSSQVLNVLSQKADEIIFARVFSISELGVYYSFKQIAVQLSSMYFNLSRRIFLPYLTNKEGKLLYEKFSNGIIGTYLICLFVVIIPSESLLEYIFNVPTSNENIILYYFVFISTFTKYSSGNIQCAYTQVQGFPYKETIWNIYQFIILVVPLAIFSFFCRLDLNSYILIVLTTYLFLIILSYFYFDRFTCTFLAKWSALGYFILATYLLIIIY